VALAAEFAVRAVVLGAEAVLGAFEVMVISEVPFWVEAFWLLPPASVRRRRRGRAGASAWARGSEGEELEVGVVLPGRLAAMKYSKKSRGSSCPAQPGGPRRVVVDC